MIETISDRIVNSKILSSNKIIGRIEIHLYYKVCLCFQYEIDFNKDQKEERIVVLNTNQENI